MRSVKTLLLVIMACSLLSCETTKHVSATSGGKTSKCGEILVGVTTEKHTVEVAGATLKDFSLGKVQTEITPEFQRIASEAAMNEDSRVTIACRAIEMSGGSPSDERFSYYMQLLGFLGSVPPPTVEQRMAWAEKFPVPKAAPQEQPTSRESSEIRFAKSCKQPVDGLRRQPEFFVPIWLDMLRILYKEKFPQDRDLINLYRTKGRYRDHSNGPDDFFSESLYTLKCLEDVGQVKLQKLGTSGEYEGKAFDNQRIVFRIP